MQPTNSVRIKELRAWAKENLANTEVFHDGLGKHIIFSVSGIKEYLNQPHEFYFEKNEMITDIQTVIRNSTYMGLVHFKDRISHIFEIEIMGKSSWLIANEYAGRGITLYSVSDSAKVLTGVQK